MINIVSKRCIVCKKTRANFGYTCCPKTHCAKCKKKYMINKPYSFCTYEQCPEFSTYGISKPERCEIHKNNEDIYWLVKPCDRCKRENELLNKDNLCIICADIPFYEENKKRQKVKENVMIGYLRENIDKKETLSDKIIDTTCNSYRPDLLYDCDTHIIVIECDEEQHKNYNWDSCASNKSLNHAEEKRMYSITQAYGLPAIFLRWNPDNFRVNNNLVKKYSIDKRLEILKNWVKHCFKMDHKQGVIYKKLFYDQYNEYDLEFLNITEENIL